MTPRDTFFQIARFGVAGAALTLLLSALYLLIMAVARLSPQMALISATLLASLAGYFVHANFSFRQSGGRDRFAIRFTRFLVTNGLGYLLNLIFVLVLVDWAHLPTWVPVIPFCLVTPMFSFLLNRHWVFG